MKKYNISTNLIRVITNFYDKATSAVLFKSSIGDWFQATVGVQQGCLLSPTLFNIFLEVERIIAEEQAGFRAGRSNHQFPLWWWRRWLSGRGRTGKMSWASRQSLHTLRHGDQCREDQVYLLLFFFTFTSFNCIVPLGFFPWKIRFVVDVEKDKTFCWWCLLFKLDLMTNDTSGNSKEIKVNRQKLETVTSFK